MLIGVGVHLSRPLAFVWVLPAVAALIALAVVRNKRPSLRKEVLLAVRMLVAFYVVGIAVITLWPLHFDASVHRMVERGNLVPFHGSLGFLISHNSLRQQVGGRDVLANVVLYTPIGLLLPSAIGRGWPALIGALFVLGLLAFGLEILQGLAVSYRTFDVDDAIAGFAGATGAAIVGGILRPLTRPVTRL